MSPTRQVAALRAWSISAPIPCASWCSRGWAKPGTRSSTRRPCCASAAACRATGRLNEEAIAQALTVMHRYHAVARAMGADPFEVLATAAVRDAANGRDFVAALQARMPGVPIRILSGEKEARAFGRWRAAAASPTRTACSADIGGGSLELVRAGGRGAARAADAAARRIRLAERPAATSGPRPRDRRAGLAGVPWLGGGRGARPVSGRRRVAGHGAHAHGADRLSAEHGPSLMIGREEARDLAGVVAGAARARRWNAAGRAAAADRRPALRRGGAAPAAAGDRRAAAWYSAPTGCGRAGSCARMPDADPRARSRCWPLGTSFAARFARDPACRRPARLDRPGLPRRGREASGGCGRRRAGCPTSAATTIRNIAPSRPSCACCGSRGRAGPPRARLPRVRDRGSGTEAKPNAPFLQLARPLLSEADALRAQGQLGAALRLAYTLCGGTPDLLEWARLRLRGGKLVLELMPGSGVFAGESVSRRLEALGGALGVQAAVETLS